VTTCVPSARRRSLQRSSRLGEPEEDHLRGKTGEYHYSSSMRTVSVTRGVRTVDFGVMWSKSINCSKFREFQARPPGFGLPTPEGSMRVGHGCPILRYCRYFSYDVVSVCIQPYATPLRRPTSRPTSSSLERLMMSTRRRVTFGAGQYTLTASRQIC
jgi:hypothetical protein